jgi:chromosome segregation ATPase
MPTATDKRPATNEAPDSPDAAERARDQGRRIRAEAASMRAHGAALVAEARAALTAAERRAGHLDQTAGTAERVADELDARARTVDHVRSTGQQSETLDAAARALSDEHAALTRRVADLEQRLSVLRGERDGLSGRLTAARSAGDLAGVKALRPDLDATEEVIGDLSGQLGSARSRLAHLGAPDADAPLGNALTAAQLRRRSYEEGLRDLAPQRVSQEGCRAVAYYLRGAERAGDETESAMHARIAAILNEDPATAALLESARALRDRLDAR